MYDAKSMALLVEEITAKVREKLQAGGTWSPTGTSPPATLPCTLTNLPCALCGDCFIQAEALAGAGADRIGGVPGAPQVPAALSKYIDHTLLKADATKEDVIKLCEEAVKHNFASVCVNPSWVRLAKGCVERSSVKVVAVVGFPLGATAAEAKAFEAREAVRQGAEEIDMVINIGALRSGEFSTVFDDIRKVVEAVRPVPVKVILETSMLNEEQKVIGSTLSKLAGAAFVKTSTGFSGGGATAEDVALMRKVVGPEMGVKASGGVRNTDDAKKMIEAGATRIGASASVGIVTGQAGSGKGY